MNWKTYPNALFFFFLAFLISQPVSAYNELDFGKLIRTGNCRKCNLDGAPLMGADLTGADLRGSSLRGAKLQKATLYKARLPDKKLYKYTNFTGAMWVNGRICRAGSIGKCTCRTGDWSESGSAEECVPKENRPPQ